MIPRLEIHFSLPEQGTFLFGRPYVPQDREFLLNHARSGILLSLQATGLPAGSRVGVMVYNCHTVMNAVAQAGYEPVFLDVTDGLALDMEDLSRKAEGLSALVVTHLFGIVNDVQRIRALYPGLVIIEDCAHACGLSDLYGDFAVFSIGQGKLPSIGDGGILLVLNEAFKSRVASLYSALPGYSFSQNARLFLKMCVWSWMHAPIVYQWVTLPVKGKRPASSGKEPIDPKRMSRGISAVYARKRPQIPALIELRKKNARELMAALPTGATCARVGENAFMLVLSCDDPASVKESFRRKGIDSETHFAHAVDWARGFGYVPGTCPRAERLVGHLLMIPTYYSR